MPKLPQGHRIVFTDDGSETLFSELFNEACHSTAGARAETRFHYIQGCKLSEMLEVFDEIHILEVGFGTGIGWLETREFFKAYPHKKLKFISLELDVALLEWSVPEAKKINPHTFQLVDMNCELQVLIGDARHTIHSLPTNFFHAIYQDAFSPKRNPTLWTHQWFSDLKRVAHPSCTLATYSASVSIRKSLLKAGWSVFEGPAFAQKRSSTRANLSDTMKEDFLAKLNTHTILALDDKDFL
jgi:tRNA U34 5-methylaminomethyl-2-thiouridine-forming methyltransferase MnmC